jgi:hypothetical protein
MPGSTKLTEDSDSLSREQRAEPGISSPHVSDLQLSDRLAFLGFGVGDCGPLKGLQKPFAKVADEFFSEFYRRLTANPQVAALLQTPGTIDRLMGLQRTYFTQLLSGPYDQKYAESRLKIGATHERIGLEPTWYLGAYCLYTQRCFPGFAAELGATFPPALLSLLKIIFADMSLVLDTYFASATQQLRERNLELEVALKMYFQAEMQLQHHAQLASHEKVYFTGFARLLRGGETFQLEGRNRRPPTDPVNALLSFVYSLLTKELTVTLQAVGFDPHLGFLHQPHYGRPSLALDLAEEFRPLVADSIRSM